MKRLIILMLSGFLSMHYAMAEDMPSPPSTPARALSPTQQWLELQRSNKAASTQAQPMSGEVMDRVHKRYLKSFEKPIPEYYEHEMPTTR
ncbi:DUF3613 domain-containing protein [Methylophilus sp. 5]|uniref:DUF3613 domain-containing protein n=1 Tax=Methylophilus sp. 5 TaxID=1112274 RepID=UPI00048FBF50|nr:DUF3613 domain-containing protein [Methylophilus sp. 5]